MARCFPSRYLATRLCRTRRLRSNDRKSSGVAVNSALVGAGRAIDAGRRRDFARSSTSSRCRSRACSDFERATHRSSARAPSVCLDTKRGSPVAPGHPALGRRSRCCGATLIGAARSTRRALVLARRAAVPVARRRASARDPTEPRLHVSRRARRDRASTRSWRWPRAGAFDAGLDRVVAARRAFRIACATICRLASSPLRRFRSIANRRRGRTPGRSVFDESLTIVYRILFLLFAESRDLVPRDHPIYRRAYSIGDALPGCAERSRGAPTGSWDGLAAITRLSRRGCRTDDLIVRPFNGRLFARAAAPSLEVEPRSASRRRRRPRPRDARAGRAHSSRSARGPDRGGREEISYADLGVEQLGAVYERVLDLEPGAIVDGVARRPGRSAHSAAPQTDRYVLHAAIACRVRRPPHARAARPTARPSDAILALRVVDPAMGSGAFLVAACRYLAGGVRARARRRRTLLRRPISTTTRARTSGGSSRSAVSPASTSNPVAVQLARLSLWLTTLARGKPLELSRSSLARRQQPDRRLARRSCRVPAAIAPASGRTSLPLFEPATARRRAAAGRAPLAELLTSRATTPSRSSAPRKRDRGAV